MVAFNKDMIPNSINTLEGLLVWAGSIAHNAASLNNIVYTNENGVLESVASRVTWPIRPPASQNTVSQQIDYFLFRCAIAQTSGWEMLPGKQWEHTQEFITSAEFQIPSEWLN